MALDEQDLRSGLKFICGTWQVDFVVNAFSNDLARIPASEWKSDDGSDFSRITYIFEEDHTLTMRDDTTGKESKGTWEQTDMVEYHYTLQDFFDVPEGVLRKNAETLLVQDGFLCFSIGFLAIGMKKIEEGHVTEIPDIKDMTPSAEDEALMGIVGKYHVEKAMDMINDSFELFTVDEIRAEAERQLAAGEIDEDELSDKMSMFDCIYEFTEEHELNTWMKVPANVTEEEIQEAIEAGEISEVVDGYFISDQTSWKAIGGKYYYDTGEQREVFGEVQSSWDELVEDENGCIPFASGMVLLKRI